VSSNLGRLYHWSPAANHDRIQKRGLKPTVETTVHMHPVPVNTGHSESDDELETFMAVCLGTSPSVAWALSGVWSAERGETWDLWEVVLEDEDEVHIRTEYGQFIHEVRVLNKIPRGRCWYVGSRTVKARGSKWYA
jgi:hypothetical protein